MIMELLKQLYKIHSPSGKERAMKKFIRKYVKRRIPDITLKSDRKGNLYMIKGSAETYPCIVAHLDQVQKNHSNDFIPIETKELIFGYSPKHRRPEGLGADDKNGIWIALRCLEKYDALKVAFFVEEEIGCRGSIEADMDFFMDCRFVIQPDRRGCKDLISSIGWTGLCSAEFLKSVGYEKFGYQETDGMMTDVLPLKERGLAVSCINLSCGYYEPHTDREFTVKEDLINCLHWVEHIIETCTDVYPHIYNMYKADGRYAFLWDDEYEEAVNEIFGMLDMDDTLGVDDLEYMYGLYFPHLTKEHFIQIYQAYHDLRQDDLPEESEDYNEEQQDFRNLEFLHQTASFTNGFIRKTDFSDKGASGKCSFIKESQKQENLG